MRSLLILLALATVATPAFAQHEHHAAGGHAGHEGGQFPAGWQARTDRDQPLTDAHFMAMGDGFHAITGPAAVFYNPEWSKSGEYEVSARFTQTRAPRNPESYGIAIGGRDLARPTQAYTYFLVRGTGEYFIATRRGEERIVQTNWTAHDAIQKQNDRGRQVNVLGARVAGSEVVFTVNGQEVARKPRSEVVTDGIFGFRVNHSLDVMIEQVRR